MQIISVPSARCQGPGAAHVDAFLTRLAHKVGIEPGLSQTTKDVSLLHLLDQLIQNKKLASAAIARSKENLNTFKFWLEQDNIPYKQGTST